MKRIRKPLIFGSLLLVWGLLSVQIFSVIRSDPETYDTLKVFVQVYQIVNASYVEEVDSVDLLESAKQGLVAGLDGQSYYVPADRVEEFQAFRSRQSSLSGLTIIRMGSFYLIQNVVPGSPGDSAGVSPGTLLEKISGADVSRMSLWEIENILNGEAGDTVNITYLDSEQEKPREAAITLVPFDVTPFKRYDHGAYPVFQVAEFTSPCLDRMEKELSRPGLQQVIVDLRRGAGGGYQEAVDAASIIAESIPPVVLKGKEHPEKELKSERSSVAGLKKVVLLVDDTVAGPAEVFAGILKADERVILVGRRTAGLTGSQEFVPVDDSGLWLTTATYRVGGNAIHNKGIVPDHPVAERSWRDKGEEDLLIQKAVEILETSQE